MSKQTGVDGSCRLTGYVRGACFSPAAKYGAPLCKKQKLSTCLVPGAWGAFFSVQFCQVISSRCEAKVTTVWCAVSVLKVYFWSECAMSVLKVYFWSECAITLTNSFTHGRFSSLFKIGCFYTWRQRKLRPWFYNQNVFELKPKPTNLSYIGALKTGTMWSLLSVLKICL